MLLSSWRGRHTGEQLLSTRIFVPHARRPMQAPFWAPSSLSAEYDGVFSTNITDEDVLQVPNIRHMLSDRDSPFVATNNRGGGFVADRDFVALQTLRFESTKSASFESKVAGDYTSLPTWAQRAGPHAKIYRDPAKVSAAVVTCGGLCPGLNDVVQSIVVTLVSYGVPEKQIWGIRYGLRGFYEEDLGPMDLTLAAVDGIHLRGGTILGTSRGGSDIERIVHSIGEWKLDMVFVIGGDGGNAAANAINEACNAESLPCSVVAVPKSVDNDILLIDRCFGFESAVAAAQDALMAAKTEAQSALRGVGLVKVMGRKSGFIAMQASMASGIVDVCIIPEIEWAIEELIAYVEHVLSTKKHIVICVAEGAGQEILQEESNRNEQDASGNIILQDIGKFLAGSLKDHFSSVEKPIDLKYIDPTYMVRAIRTIPQDHIYCKVLGQNAVHAAFAGLTGCTTGMLNTDYVLLPIPTLISHPRRVNTGGRKWNRLLTAINQPDLRANTTSP